MKKTFDLSITSSFLLILLSLFGVSKINSHLASSSLKELEVDVEEFVEVTVLGAVKKQATYQVPIGSPLGWVVRKAKPMPFADLQKIDLQNPVVAPITVVLEELKEIVVRVEGFVEPAAISLPVGSRVCDLKGKIVLKEGDETFFKSVRKLKPGEILRVPKKTS